MSKLRDFREALNMSQEEFATFLKMNRRTYACYEIHTRFPKSFNRQKLLKAAREKNFPLVEKDLLRK